MPRRSHSQSAAWTASGAPPHSITRSIAVRLPPLASPMSAVPKSLAPCPVMLRSSSSPRPRSPEPTRYPPVPACAFAVGNSASTHESRLAKAAELTSRKKVDVDPAPAAPSARLNCAPSPARSPATLAAAASLTFAASASMAASVASMRPSSAASVRAAGRISVGVPAMCCPVTVRNRSFA